MRLRESKDGQAEWNDLGSSEEVKDRKANSPLERYQHDYIDTVRKGHDSSQLLLPSYLRSH